MSLPKIEYPTFEITIPSTGKKLTFRPFLSKEEKILLFAAEGKDKKEIVKSIKQVINNCLIDDEKVSKFSIIDLEYVFLKLRARSVNNVLKASFKDSEDEKIYDFDIDLNKIEVIKNPQNDPHIKITKDVGLILKAPDSDIDEVLENAKTEQEIYDKVLKYCIEQIYDEDTVYLPQEQTEKELDEFLNSLPHGSFDKIQKFFSTLPVLYYEINYKNSLGNDRKIVVNTLLDFFI